jgi:hypothetical protein
MMSLARNFASSSMLPSISRQKGPADSSEHYRDQVFRLPGK